MSFWAVAQTIADRELAVARRLDHAGYAVLAPRARFGSQSRICALFPGYVFLQITDAWYSAQFTIGVLRLIMSGDQPARCPDWEIKKIREATGKNGLVRLPKEQRMPPTLKITEGTNVRIVTGSFRGLHAIYQGSSPRERELVLLDLLGRQVPVELASTDRIEAL